LITLISLGCPTHASGSDNVSTIPHGNTFLALPERGPNAVPYDSNSDDTASYINRFHTISMDLQPNTSGTGLPFTIRVFSIRHPKTAARIGLSIHSPLT
jgi:hypothetical protein